MELNEGAFQLDSGCISGRPLTVGDLKKIFHDIDAVYRYLDSMDETTKEVFKPVLYIAGDYACNLCYELGFDSPDAIAFGEYYVYQNSL